MKKIYILMAGLAVLFGSASCNKVDDKGARTPDVKIEINVADLNTSTKAVKTGWEDGDVINVYLSDATSYVPDFTLTYNGETWVSSVLTDEVKGRLEPSGTIKGFWEASNTAATTGGDWDRYNSYIYFDNDSPTGTKDYLTAYFSVYYLYEDGILSAEIDSWRFPSGLTQIVVTGLDHDQFYLTTEMLAKFNCYDITDDDIFPDLYSAGPIAGIENEDGIAFVGRLRMYCSKNDVVELQLHDLNDGGKVYKFTKTLESDLNFNQQSSIYAIKIPFSKFVPEE